MLPRFLVNDLDPAAETATLTGGEAHHLTRVLRLGVGDDIAVFDGRGAEFRARVDRITGSIVTVRLQERMAPAAERRVSTTLAQAVLKGSSMDDVVRDATMMGVVAIIPLVTEHTIAKRAASAHSAERWRRIAVASAKQCRRARVPDVGEPVTFESWLAQPRTGSTLLLVEPTVRGVQALSVRSLTSSQPPSAAMLVVGPEGGWAAGEVQAATGAGLLPLTLGPLILRAEAVPLAALAALTVVWD